MASHVLSPQRTPYVPQDHHEVAGLVRDLEAATSKKKGGPSVKKTTFVVKDSENGASVHSWRMGEQDYKRLDAPSYARGLFTTKNSHHEPEIAIRGYDKFFNVGEVHETKWENIKARCQGPFELSLKENGCIIFISGLEDGTLLVCSKHSTGDRQDADLSHATAGERWVQRQLQALGKTKQELARELRSRNATAVAELCDDSFEEHVLEYGAEKAGLYLHGINLNVPRFVTYPSSLVQEFARDWGFKQTQVIVMDEVEELKALLHKASETGSWDGREVEGFVIRCQMSHYPNTVPYHDWFFKFKFEEPYLMYRQWRECTKALIAGRKPVFKKHVKITEEYLLYARKRLASDPKLSKLYMQNHGILGLRDDFLKSLNLKGSEAATLEGYVESDVQIGVTKDVMLVPISTIGCGKTTLALSLGHIFGWGHVQNDNITGARRPPRFTQQCLDWLARQPVVFADRNNAEKRERQQILKDVKLQNVNVRLIALYFNHDSIDKVRETTRARVLERGDNHQTINAKSDEGKCLGVMEGFIKRFEPFVPYSEPDSGFDGWIELDPTAASRVNLEKIVMELHRMFPNMVKELPSSEQMDDAVATALVYKPNLQHTILERSKKVPAEQRYAQPVKKKAVEYVSVNVPKQQVLSVLEAAFANKASDESRFYTQLKKSRRIQPAFHVTLMHRATAKEHPELWDRYIRAHAAAETSSTNGDLGICDVIMERVVFDGRVMAIVVRLDNPRNDEPWECFNKIAHITIGTRDDTVKPKESNALLARWLEEGVSEPGGCREIIFDKKPTVSGNVACVLAR